MTTTEIRTGTATEAPPETEPQSPMRRLGTVASYVCFRRPEVTVGRFAVAYAPNGSLSRAMLYFDANGAPMVVTPPG